MEKVQCADLCIAPKHHSRNRSHAWQEVTKYDLIYPNYVWQHVRDLNGQCMQAGAPVPDQYRSMMSLDVVPPDCDEVDLVACNIGFCYIYADAM
nr:apo protein 3, mitochondrial [Quercus suber]